MTAYVIVDIDVHDPVGSKEYREARGLRQRTVKSQMVGIDGV